MKKILVVLALVVTTGATVFAIDNDKDKGRKERRKDRKEMKCCTKEMEKSCSSEEKTACKKEGKTCCDKTKSE